MWQSCIRQQCFALAVLTYRSMHRWIRCKGSYGWPGVNESLTPFQLLKQKGVTENWYALNVFKKTFTEHRKLILIFRCGETPPSPTIADQACSAD